MEKKYHRNILIISLITVTISLIAFVSGLLLRYDEITFIGFFGGIYSMSALLTVNLIKYPAKRWLKTASRYSSVVFPIIILLYTFILFTYGEFPGFTILYLVLTLILLFALFHYFLFSDVLSLKGIIFLLIFFVLGIILKKRAMAGAGVFISLSSLSIGIGSFIYAIRSIYMDAKLPYLKNISIFGSLIISVSFLGHMFKLQHWLFANYLIIIGFGSMILGTIYLLITLPSSGFIDWNSDHKKGLKRLLIPWVFIFILFMARFMVPELNTIIWGKALGKPEIKATAPYGFEMTDYPVVNKNGLEPK
jgi:hypothetical protein